MQPYILRSSEEMECGTETFYNPPIMFPTRPKWDHSLSRTKLEQQEQRYFQVLLCVEFGLVKEFLTMYYLELSGTWNKSFGIVGVLLLMLHHWTCHLCWIYKISLALKLLVSILRS